MIRSIKTVAPCQRGGWYALLDCGHTVLLGHHEPASRTPRKGYPALCDHCAGQSEMNTRVA
jgi:hypothetical protein